MDVVAPNHQLHAMYTADTTRASARDREGEPMWGGVVICQSISIENFICWLGHDEGELQRWRFEPASPDGGRVVKYSLPTPLHSMVALAVADMVRDQLAAVGHETALKESLVEPVSAVCRIQEHLQEPDYALVPRTAPKDQPPTLVIEVAFLNETRAAMEIDLLVG